MKPFNFVIFGFTSNLAQLKIIPALYGLEEKGLLPERTKKNRIGRKQIDVSFFIGQVLHSENRHHSHIVDPLVESRLVSRVSYLREDFEVEGTTLYSKLKNISGNTLYYLATYPNLYIKIFQLLKDNRLNEERGSWTRIMIEKPIGSNYQTAKNLNKLLEEYFHEDQVFRVDHYLGKESLRKIFLSRFKKSGVERIEATVAENFGIGKRGVYYEATGALLDVGQNHLLQMIAAVAAKSSDKNDRAEVLESLIANPNAIVFGQYNGYRQEENVNPDSNVDTYFALKTELVNGPLAGVPIYLSAGKCLDKDEAKIVIYYNDGNKKTFLISPLDTPDKFDPYERLILEAVNGDQTFFNSSREIEAAWKFVDRLSEAAKKIFIYKKGSNLMDDLHAKFMS
ncbi:hypothetical protein M1615_02005 [Patescibacteria group bacterium]|nr:hypothetical protein [Patescibacteria group bacterium]